MWVGAFGCVRVRACVCVYAVHSLEQTNRTWTHAGLLSTQMAEEHPLPVTTQPVLLLIHRAHSQFCCLSIKHTTSSAAYPSSTQPTLTWPTWACQYHSLHTGCSPAWRTAPSPHWCCWADQAWEEAYRRPRQVGQKWKSTIVTSLLTESSITCMWTVKHFPTSNGLVNHTPTTWSLALVQYSD